jgi:1,4-alpha-glucan branching enzyme
VFLTGSFNDWNPTALEMVDAKGDGTFTATLTLPAGTYEYKFVVDGAWLTDPAGKETVANEYGTLNSILVV